MITLEAILEEIRALTIQERKRLIHLIIETLPEDEVPLVKHTLSITELRGLGKELWQGVDAQTYVDQIRSEWDHRQTIK